MSNAIQIPDRFSAHALCMAAGARDGLRTVQYYVKDLTAVDGGVDRRSTALSRLVAKVARAVDFLMTRGANLSIDLLLPKWRQLPSPFAPGFIDSVASAITHNSFVHNPLFNAYFFRSSQTILGRWAKPPYLVLEHRVDAARRALAGQQLPSDKLNFLSHTLIALVETAPIARYGAVRTDGPIAEDSDANAAIFSVACVALLLAQDGGEIKGIGDDEFFAIVGALMAPRLEAIQKSISNRNVASLAQQLQAIRDLY